MTARAAAAVLILCCASSPAWAQDSAAKAAANTLFDEGQALMKAGKTAEACTKFEASIQTLPQLGVRLNLANCYKQLGRTASAWAEFRESASLAQKRGDTQREEFARAQVAELEPRLIRLTVKVTGEVEGQIVRRSGREIPRALYGSKFPIDPGEHTLEASAPMYKTWSTKITVTDAQKEHSVEVPALEKDPDAVPPIAGPIDRGPSDPGKTRRIAGLAVGGAGVAMLGVGIFFGFQAKGKWDDSKEFCNENVECTQGGVDLVNDAKSAATISTILVIGGGLAVAGGIVLFLTAPKAKKVEKGVSWTPVVSPQFTGVSLGARF
jgi:tetratricopeptide (TPR) repeat protein